MTVPSIILFCFTLWISLNLVSARPYPRTCKANNGSSQPPPAAPTQQTPAIAAAPAPQPTVTPQPTVAPSPPAAPSYSGCFPSMNFQMPSAVPDSLTNWWCPMDTEYAFMGFSYEVSSCQSLDQLNREFGDIKNTFQGRYVRLYGACDNPGFYDNVVEAAWNNGIGVHALIWFGFDGSNQWQTRRDSLVNTLTTNPKAKFVTRGVQFGSEPLFDGVISPSDLAGQVYSLKGQLAGVQIPVTVSELAYGYQENGGAQDVLDSLDYINMHMLPFFSTLATTGDLAWPLVQADLNWFIQQGGGKKMYMDENGWPSYTSDGVQANSGAAVASVWSEQAYYQLLDNQCQFFKTAPGGGIGWFAHIYSDNQEPGYGIYDGNGNLKFNFQPRTSC